MNLNRDNYEEFFLLYVDNELSAADKAAVDAFVRANPDLAEELALLQASMIKPDLRIRFESKQSLLKGTMEQDLVHPDRYETLFLLYCDNELDDKERLAVEIFVASRPDLQQELDWLLRSRLQADPGLVFEPKSLLYRPEAKKPVVWMRWTRIAVAAALLLLAGSVLFWIRLSKSSNPSIAKIDRQAAAGVSAKSDKIPGHVTSAVPSPLYPASKDAGQEQTPSMTSTGSGFSQQHRNLKRYPAPARQQDQQGKTPVGDQSQVPADIADVQQHSAVVAGTAVALADHQAPSVSLQVQAPGRAEPQQVLAPGDYTGTAVSEADLAFNKEDGINIMTFTARKSNMRGFFRKVTRVFEKTTNADDENRRGVLVGNFQIPVKKS